MPRTQQWTTVGLPTELAEEIHQLAEAEDRKKYAIVRRAIDLYRRYSRLLDEPEMTLAEARAAVIASRQHFVEAG